MLDLLMFGLIAASLPAAMLQKTTLLGYTPESYY